MEHELNPSKIVGECFACRHLYDVCNGFVCDECGYAGPPRGARWATTEGPVIDLDPEAMRDIVWLEKLYALEDNRP